MMQKYQDSSLSPEERASDLLARMDLDENLVRSNATMPLILSLANRWRNRTPTVSVRFAF